MALDPVCGRVIHPKQSDWLLSYNGKTYHFCSGDCEHRFDSDPSEYAESAAKAEAAHDAAPPRAKSTKRVALTR